ncbi:hypothetical protein D0869_01220 [Hortaea werneckii]|uniref:Hpc2-related domain-containing protein n=1 Tax=Hortaea werneckii TaxID=91943 RepID=A0A3M6XEQ9_HORWE|nr:hypothetical protein D0869_01220 [Hortaea werneckii]RMY15279.1 hypothetical protein D0868_00986 [Hortaea werneckii]
MNAPPGFAERMAADASEHSSSSLSPPPSPNTIRVAAGAGGSTLSGKSTQPSTLAANNDPAHATNPTAPSNTAPEKPKRRRKDAGADGNESKPKTTKPRKPREPKATTGTAASRKKQKTEDQPHQQTLTSMVNGSQQPLPARSAAASPLPQHISNQPLSASNQPASRPASNGHTYVRGYDPVRGAMMDAEQYRPTSASTSVQAATASPQVNRASASPSIASLIDPPAASAKTSVPNLPYSSQANVQHQQQSFAHSPDSQHRSPEPLNTLPAPLAAPPQIPTKSPQSMEDVKSNTVPNMDGAMDVDMMSCDAQAPTKSLQPPQPDHSKLATSKSSSSGPTPKPTRPTPPPAPKGTGSGLLSGHDLFGGTTSSKDKADGNPRGVNIDIRIPLNPMGGNTINIAQEIAKKYGRDAINPRAAAHREQLLKFQAAANRLEGAEGSALDDTMSVDISDGAGGGGDDGSNVEMGGMGGAGGEEAGSDNNNNKPKQRQRRKKVEEYDKEDDFIDDTELAWQEQAAVSKDGFFVYSGPLIPEGQTANVESAAQPTSGRGRGRGRGRGSRGGATAASAAGVTTHASLAAEKKDRDPSAPSPAPRARGRGRGTGAPRKPRITKADRERMEVEKVEREKAAAGAGAGGVGGVGNHVKGPLPATGAGMHGGQQQQQPFNGPTGGTVNLQVSSTTPSTGVAQQQQEVFSAQ